MLIPMMLILSCSIQHFNIIGININTSYNDLSFSDTICENIELFQFRRSFNDQFKCSPAWKSETISFVLSNAITVDKNARYIKLTGLHAPDQIIFNTSTRD